MAVSTQPIHQPAGNRREEPLDGGMRRSSDGFVVNTLVYGDLTDALRKGLADFKAMPSHLVFIAVIYPLGMIVLARLTYSFDVLPMIFPLVAGFAILGPFIGLGLYEISRRREMGAEPRWRDMLKVWDSPGRGSILAIGLLLFLVFAAWMFVADRLYAQVMAGQAFDSVGAFLSAVLTTSEGWTLIVAGHVVGFCFAALAFALSAVSFPMLLDRDAGAGEAIRASVLTVRRNPLVMALWAAIIAAALMAGTALFLAGLAVVLPVLAHASWHLYRRALTWT
jgi:uncharacterized membrane protein